VTGLSDVELAAMMRRIAKAFRFKTFRFQTGSDGLHHSVAADCDSN
jgi:hypothetical protein